MKFTKSNLVEVLDNKFYIFKNASEYEIKNTLPKDWSCEDIYFVNCDSKEELMSVAEARSFWKNR